MSIPKQFLKFFSDHPPAFPSDNTTKMKVDGRLFDYADPASVTKLLSAEVVLKYDLGEWYKLDDKDQVEYVKNFIEGTYRQDLARANERREKIESKIAGTGMKLPDTDYILENLQPCRLVGSQKKEGGFVLLDRMTGKVTEYDYYSIYYALLRDVEDKLAKKYLQTIAHLKVEYNPYEIFKLKLVDGSNNQYIVNTYEPPTWKSIYDEVEANYDEDIEKLINHLFPKKEDREFVFNWIYHSLTTRSGTYLYLCGGQGSGKNTLALLLSKLHGYHNSSSPKQDSLRNRFNFYLKEKRLVFFDEFNCRGRQDKDILKSIINNRVQIEGKGKDHEDVEVFASYVIANNSLEAIGLDPVDRRFSVPDITHENITDKYPRKWIRELIKKFDNDLIIASFAKYVLENYEDTKYYNEEPYQKSRFEEIVFATARMGISETLAKVLKKEQPEYDYFDEKGEFGRTHKGHRYPSIQDWQKFFKDVRRDGKPIGRVEGKMFYPIDSLRPDADEDLI